MAPVITVRSLAKSYGDVQAVRGIDFDVEHGSLFAFLGPNGAGKSTTIEMLCTLLRADAGTVQIADHVLGKENHAIRQCIGVVFQQSVLDDMLSVRENLYMRGSMYGLNRRQLDAVVARSLAVVEAQDFADRRHGQLSGGQRRRADIARALLHQPEILFLDEPTTGLDPETRGSIWQTISSMQRANGLTVFLTTHYMEEAAEADRVAVIDRGAIIENATPGELKQKYARDSIRLYGADQAALDRLHRKGIVWTEDHGIVKVAADGNESALRILNMVARSVSSFEVRRGTMDDVFLSIIGSEPEHDGTD